MDPARLTFKTGKRTFTPCPLFDDETFKAYKEPATLATECKDRHLPHVKVFAPRAKKSGFSDLLDSTGRLAIFIACL